MRADTHSLAAYVAEIRHRQRFLRCPSCQTALVFEDTLYCARCHRDYFDRDVGIVRLLPAKLSGTKAKIQSFWGDTYRQWYACDEFTYTPESLLQELVLLEDLFTRRRHLATTEVHLKTLGGKELLEIGSGSGGHSALFRKYGAHVTSIDLTEERVEATSRKLQLLRTVPSGSGLAIQADAETLPFQDCTFDIVYSNGVLHHTEDTERCVEEVFRVLKPGGEAIIMLYSRDSVYFWCTLVPLGIVTGLKFRYPLPKWVGMITEGRPRFQSETNQLTRVFNRRDIDNLFSDFERVFVRKSGFFVSQLPLPAIGRVRDRVMTLFGASAHVGGKIVYGKPIIPESRMELWLGSILGFCWDIRAMKGPRRQAAVAG